MVRLVGPSRAASLEPLAHRQNVASLSFFYRYYQILLIVTYNFKYCIQLVI